LSVTQAFGRRNSTDYCSPPARRERQVCLEFPQRLIRTLQIEQQLGELLTGRDDWARRDRKFLDCILLICCRTQTENCRFRVTVGRRTPSLGLLD
jgi:hypothetical protein